MLIKSIQEFAQRMEHRLSEMTLKLIQEINFAIIESELNQECAQLNAALQQAMLQELLRKEFSLRMLTQAVVGCDSKSIGASCSH